MRRNVSTNSLRRSATAPQWKWCFLVILALVCPLIAAGQKDDVIESSPVVEYYEEVIEDRYDLMDINDPIYESLFDEDNSPSQYRYTILCITISFLISFCNSRFFTVTQNHLGHVSASAALQASGPRNGRIVRPIYVDRRAALELV